MLATFKTLMQDETGVSVVEFALLAPVLLVTLLGLFDFSYNFYAETIIEGAVQKAARDSTIERYANNPDALDARVRVAVQRVVPSANVIFNRRGYENYADVGRPEDFTDTNGDGVCNANEPFEDANGNGVWDTDRALDSSAGARDAVLYEAVATYDRAFPMAELIGLPATVTVASRTVLRNQPYSADESSAAVGNCTI